jgi:hypothetical protein
MKPWLVMRRETYEEMKRDLDNGILGGVALARAAAAIACWEDAVENSSYEVDRVELSFQDGELTWESFPAGA